MRRLSQAVIALFVISAGSAAAATVDGANIHWTSRGSGSPAVINVPVLAVYAGVRPLADAETVKTHYPLAEYHRCPRPAIS